MPLAVPVQDTYSVGQILTAASLNKNVRDAVTFLASVPLFVGAQSSAQTIASGTGVFAAVAIDTSSSDTYSGHSNVTNNTRYTAQVAGWYRVVARTTFPANSAGYRAIKLTVNGTDVPGSNFSLPPSGTAGTSVATASLVQLNVNDYVEMWVTQNCGSSLTLFTGTNGTYFEVEWSHA